jgi:hypothetical protein
LLMLFCLMEALIWCTTWGQCLAKSRSRGEELNLEIWRLTCLMAER